MAFGKIIRARREELDLTLDEVANLTSFSKPYLSTIETGRVRNPPSDTLLKKLEKVLQFDRGYLIRLAHLERIPPDIRNEYEAKDAENLKYRDLIQKIIDHEIDISKAGQLVNDWDLEGHSSEQKSGTGGWIPVINKVSAGYPVDFDDLGYPVGFADDYVRCPDLHDPNAFAVRVVGDSMEPDYMEEDIVIFSPSADVQSGDDCFVRFESPYETTFKRIFFEDDQKIRLQPRNNRYSPMIVPAKRLNGMYRAVRKYSMV